MAQRERIEALEAEVAQLREKIAQLEAQGHPHYPPAIPAPTPSPSIGPMPSTWQPPALIDCGCAAGTVCMNVACPRAAYKITCDSSAAGL